MPEKIVELLERFEQGELIRHREGTPLLRWMTEATNCILELKQTTAESDVVLGTCPHGVNLDTDFCAEGCRR